MTELKDDFDFNTLDPDRWESLCYSLIHSKNPLVNTVNGHGGDEGIDAYIGKFESPAVIYQFKFFRNSFGKTQVKQVNASLDAALSKRSGFAWVLMCSKDPTPEAMKALEKLRDEHSDMAIEYHFASDIAAMLIECPKVRKEFYPNTQDQLEALSLGDGNRPLDMIENGIKRYNDILIDDRFTATVTTDGKSTTITYTAKPWVTEKFSLLSARAKSSAGSEALEALYREGRPLTLTRKDIELVPRVSFLEDAVECISVSARSVPNERPGTVLLYPGDGKADSPSLLVTLKTIREGSEIGVRSNAGQQGCPVVFEFEYPTGSMDNSPDGRGFRISIKPNYDGCSVKKALRGARFLSELAETRRLGICDPNGDPDDITFCAIAGFDDDDDWKEHARFFQALKRVCDFFGLNPVFNVAGLTEEFFKRLEYFVKKIGLMNRNWPGTLTFILCEHNKDAFGSSGEKQAIVIDEIPSIEIFGIHCKAHVRYVSKGTLKYRETDSGLVCDIKGQHTIYVERVLPE